MILKTIKAINGHSAICKCDYCGKTYKRRLSRVIRLNGAGVNLIKHNFCLRECAFKWNRGKNSYIFGKKRPESTRVKISEGRKGKYGGEKNPNWKGGRRISNGYIEIYSPNHPYASRRYVKEHRLVMEKHIGRYLYPYEVVHHKNRIRDDNKIENLELIPKNNEHSYQMHKVYIENQRLKQEIKKLKFKKKELI